MWIETGKWRNGQTELQHEKSNREREAIAFHRILGDHDSSL